MSSHPTDLLDPAPGGLRVNVRHYLLGAWASLVLEMLRAEACAKVDQERQDPADPQGAPGVRLG